MVFMRSYQEIHSRKHRESSEEYAAEWIEDEMLRVSVRGCSPWEAAATASVAALQASGRHDTLGIAGLGVIEGGIPLSLERARERSGDFSGTFSGHPQPGCQR